MRDGNLLIKASAGTGKTFSLATRYMRLMLIDGVEPEKILALTFSRAAAQEIYTKILERLWKAAESEENASNESKEICKGLGIDRSWKAETFVFLLRRLLDTQHLGTIATFEKNFERRKMDGGREIVFEQGVEPVFKDGRKPDAAEQDHHGETCTWRHDEPAVLIERVSPSSAGHAGPAFSRRFASELFSQDTGLRRRGALGCTNNMPRSNGSIRLRRRTSESGNSLRLAGRRRSSKRAA